MAAINILEEDRGVGRCLTPPLPFVIRKEERLVFTDRAAERRAKLVLAECVEPGQGQDGLCVGRTILQIIVDRAVEIVRARLRDNVHEATQLPAIVCPEAVVY